MIEIDVRLGARSYPVSIGSWRDWDLRSVVRDRNRGSARWALVADRKVWEVWGRDLEACAGSAGLEFHPLLLDAGEAQKSHETLFRIYDHLLATRTRRDGVVAVFGGGVLGDLVGFAASTYQRGISYIQAPTTLLAQVDSSVGGKTGLNYGGHKNMIGAFHQPSAVFISPEWLATLPSREFCAGLAEVVKCGVVRDAELLGILETEEPDRLLHSARLEEVIARAVAVKASVVEADETDQGLRHILNFGHTIGHALEATSGFSRYLHGEAVAIGMVGALHLSVAEAGLAKGDLERIEALLLRFRLPVRASDVSADALMSALSMDKKAQESGGVWVLTDGMGRSTVSRQVNEPNVRSALRYIGAA